MFKFFKKAEEKVEKVLDETQKDAKKTLHKTNALIDESSDKLKIVAGLMGIGFALSSLASIASIVVSIKQTRQMSQPKVVNTIYIQGGKALNGKSTK